MSGGQGAGHRAVLVEGADGATCFHCGGPVREYNGKVEHRRGRWREYGVGSSPSSRSRHRRRRARATVVVPIGTGRAELGINRAELTVDITLRLPGHRAVIVAPSIAEARALARRLLQATDALLQLATS